MSSYSWANIVILTIVLHGLTLLKCCDAYVWNIGDCAIYYNEPCSKSVVEFKLYTHENGRSVVSALNPFRPALPRSLSPNRNVKILIHGYGGLGVDYAIKNVTAAYKETSTPVIIVDWSTIASVPCYPTAFFNTWHVGQCTAILSVSLAKLGLPPSKLHVIGFSLGAHIASFASNQLQKTLKMPFYRITGLDPALPLFATLINEWKLDPSDAPFVDVIHTSAGTFGKLEAIGHVDFYINGGTMQPNCLNNVYPQLCSHIMAGTYYAMTIRGKKLLGYACPSILHYALGLCDFGTSSRVPMGEHVSRKARGIYFVETSSPQRSETTVTRRQHRTTKNRTKTRTSALSNDSRCK